MQMHLMASSIGSALGGLMLMNLGSGPVFWGGMAVCAIGIGGFIRWMAEKYAA
jgi:hypothetical protein